MCRTTKEALRFCLCCKTMTAAVIRRSSLHPAAQILVLIPTTHCFLIASPTRLSSDLHVPAAITSRDDRFYLNTCMNAEKNSEQSLEAQWGEQIETEWTRRSVMSVCVYVVNGKHMRDEDWLLVNTQFSNLKALSGRWGYIYVAYHEHTQPLLLHTLSLCCMGSSFGWSTLIAMGHSLSLALWSKKKIQAFSFIIPAPARL